MNLLNGSLHVWICRHYPWSTYISKSMRSKGNLKEFWDDAKSDNERDRVSQPMRHDPTLPGPEEEQLHDYYATRLRD